MASDRDVEGRWRYVGAVERAQIEIIREALTDVIAEAQTPLSGTEPPWLANSVKRARKVVAALDALAQAEPDVEGVAADALRPGYAAPSAPSPEPGLPAGLLALLRDHGVIVSQDARVFDLIRAWNEAPSNTASAEPSPEPGLMVPVGELEKFSNELVTIGWGERGGLRADVVNRLDSLIAQAVPCGDELAHWLRWALETIDQYDEFLILLGEPREKVYSAVHVAGKQKARAALRERERYAIAQKAPVLSRGGQAPSGERAE